MKNLLEYELLRILLLDHSNCSRENNGFQLHSSREIVYLPSNDDYCHSREEKVILNQTSKGRVSIFRCVEPRGCLE